VRPITLSFAPKGIVVVSLETLCICTYVRSHAHTFTPNGVWWCLGEKRSLFICPFPPNRPGVPCFA